MLHAIDVAWPSESSRRSSAAGRTILRFAGIPAPVLFVRCPEVVALLPAVLKGWTFDEAAEAGRPIISVVAIRSGYRVAAPWLGEGLRVETPVAAVCRLVVDLARAWIEADRSLLCLHCGAVEIGGRLIVFPNTYRVGKSTLVAALAAGGVRVHADDILPLDTAGAGVATGVAPRLRLPMPPSVARSLATFAARHKGPADRRYQYLDLPKRLLARHGERAPIGAFVLLERERRGSPALSGVDSADMLQSVVPRNFAEGPGAPATLVRLAGLVGSRPCYALRYSDVGAAAALLTESFSDGEPRANTRRNGTPAPPRRHRAHFAEDRRFAARPGIIVRQVGADIFLADRRTGAIHALNPVGAAVWRLLARPASAAEVSATMSAVFPDRDADEIAGDIARLFDDLHRAGMIVAA